MPVPHIEPLPPADPARFAFPRTLYRPAEDRAACGTGFVASIAGERSHGILRMAVEAVINLTHRGAVSADGKTGDGAGILTQIPHPLFRRELLGLGVRLEREADLGVGMIFFPRAPEGQRLCRTIIEGTLTRHGIRQFGWRPVPIDPDALGAKALATLPRMEQVLMGRPPGTDDVGYERILYLARKEIEEQVRGEGMKEFYIPSFSHRTVVYKGLFVAPQLPRFYRDLADPLYTTALAVFHQRYSTNTFPTWFLAQPFRMLGHNGEINTLQGNQNWMYAREKELHSAVWGTRVDRLRPFLSPGGSDSAHLDNVLEALVLSGRDIRHAFMMLIPEAWENMPQMDPALRGFYEYHACLSEPWDGPAAIAFTDGVIVGATLDRNGLRPARYKVTANGIVVMASEVGVVDLDDALVIEKGRLGPGKMIAVDTARGLLLHNDETKREMAARRPYREWVGKQMVRLTPRRPAALAVPGASTSRTRLQRAFGYTAEEISLVLTPMFAEKKEPVGSMGDDTPLAVLSRRPRLLYSYFKQKFAQVTNPPIDPLREQIVMSLGTYVGARGSLLEEAPEAARLIHLESPLLYDHELEALRRMQDPLFASVTLSTCFAAADGHVGLERALRRLTEEASRAVDEGKPVLILSDRGVDAEAVPMPMLLAVGAVVHHLIRKGKGMRADVVVETGEAWEHHHFAALIGYGAAAVNPYLALQTVAAVAAEEHQGDAAAVEKALGNYRAAVEKGILKIMSKMGISALASYQGAQIFEIIGLSEAVVDRCFVGTPSKVGGVGLREIGEDCLARHRESFGPAEATALPHAGYYTYRASGEQHAFNPPMVKALHAAVRDGDYSHYRKYADLVNAREPLTLRDLLRFRPGKPIP
ncbi:MAG: glutamate synthase subunit alpha, partial [candidate division NC10 bacterium]|nr:glutamate synthase subunit alpha [candidate division NC10 bacterium]